MYEINNFGISFFKNGSGIHIKKKNRGKFTKSAKAAGQTVQQHAISVLKDPNATPLQKKRANFARNAKKFKHQLGGILGFYQMGNKLKRVNWQNVQKSTGLKVNSKNMRQIEDSVFSRKLGYPQAMAIYSQIVSENGGNPGPHGNGAIGIIGWRGSRTTGIPKDLAGQIHKLMTGIYSNPQAKDWTHGGKGTGIQTGKEMKDLFINTNNSKQATKAIMKGYVRPGEDQYDKRLKILDIIKQNYGK